MDLRAKHVRERVQPTDGERLLVTRFRLAGLPPESFHAWDKRLAPSAPLLIAYRQRRITWREFAGLYVAEMWSAAPTLRGLVERARRHPVTLLCPCRNERHCHHRLLQSLAQRMNQVPARVHAASR